MLCSVEWSIDLWQSWRKLSMRLGHLHWYSMLSDEALWFDLITIYSFNFKSLAYIKHIMQVQCLFIPVVHTLNSLNSICTIFQLVSDLWLSILYWAQLAITRTFIFNYFKFTYQATFLSYHMRNQYKNSYPLIYSNRYEIPLTHHNCPGSTEWLGV